MIKAEVCLEFFENTLGQLNKLKSDFKFVLGKEGQTIIYLCQVMVGGKKLRISTQIFGVLLQILAQNVAHP